MDIKTIIGQLAENRAEKILLEYAQEGKYNIRDIQRTGRQDRSDLIIAFWVDGGYLDINIDVKATGPTPRRGSVKSPLYFSWRTFNTMTNPDIHFIWLYLPDNEYFGESDFLIPINERTRKQNYVLPLERQTKSPRSLDLLQYKNNVEYVLNDMNNGQTMLKHRIGKDIQTLERWCQQE